MAAAREQLLVSFDACVCVMCTLQAAAGESLVWLLTGDYSEGDMPLQFPDFSGWVHERRRGRRSKHAQREAAASGRGEQQQQAQQERSEEALTDGEGEREEEIGSTQTVHDQLGGRDTFPGS